MHVQNHLKRENFEVQHPTEVYEYENLLAKIKSFNSRNKGRNEEKFDVLGACVTSNDFW